MFVPFQVMEPQQSDRIIPFHVNVDTFRQAALRLRSATESSTSTSLGVRMQFGCRATDWPDRIRGYELYLFEWDVVLLVLSLLN
jgi:hypothetical protein